MVIMKHAIYLLPIMLSCSLFGLELSRTDELIRFGDGNLSVAFNSQDGSPQGVWVGGRQAIRAVEEGDRLWLNLSGGDRQWFDRSRHSWVLEDCRKTSDNAIAHQVRCDDWRVVVHTELFPSKRELRRWLDVSWVGDKPSKIYGFSFAWGIIPFGSEDIAMLPGNLVRPELIRGSELSPNRRRSSWNYQLAIIQSGSLSACFMADELAEYFDRGEINLVEQEQAIRVSQSTGIMGHMKPGVAHRFGDYRLRFMETNAEIALTRLHDWRLELGHVPPKDRPDWVQKAILYSFHPKGSIGSSWNDWGGFRPSTEQLPRMRNLGCNALWILPIEDLSPYWPRDYYKLQEGIGTEDEYRQLVKTAHQLGFNVWQDIVPHGGSNTYQRAKDHPEWLVQAEDGSTLYYWCFDFNWPQWRDYMNGVARHHVKNFGIDGYRIDACGSSKIPNWNPDIPYGRASMALRQGGMNMQRAIREGARAENPNAATLAESGENVFSTVSDSLYDFTMCYSSMPMLRDSEPGTFVGHFRRWLHEQHWAGIPGQVLLRHIESHDSLRAEYRYGPEGMRAAMAAASWIPGIPMVYQDMEDGHAPVFRRIFAIREALPELQGHEVDYLSVQSPPTLFAVIRQHGDDASIPLVNFSQDHIEDHILVPKEALPEACRNAVQVKDLWTGKTIRVQQAGDNLKIPVQLRPFGMAMLKFGQVPQIPELETSLLETTLSGQLTPELFNLDFDGNKIPLQFTNRISSKANLSHGNLLIRIPIPKGERCDWRVTAANGRWQDQFRTRHPLFNGTTRNIYRLPSGGNVLWDSRLWPLGTIDQHARMEFATKSGRLGIQFNPKQLPAAAFILDRVGDDHVPYVFIMSSNEQDQLFGKRDYEVVFDFQANSTNYQYGDSKTGFLSAPAGQWLYDNGKVRLRLLRNGIVRSLEKYLPDGTRKSLVENTRLYTDAGYAPADGEHRSHSANDEVEPFSHIATLPNGNTIIRFYGEMRHVHRFGKLSAPIQYYTEYHLDDSDSIGMTIGVKPTAPPYGEREFVGFLMNTGGMGHVLQLKSNGKVVLEGLGDAQRQAQTKNNLDPNTIDAMTVLSPDKTFAFSLNDIHWHSEGKPFNLFIHGHNVFVAWGDGEPDLEYGKWRFFSTRLVTTATGGHPQAPAIPSVSRELKSEQLLKSPGFEEIAQFSWLRELVQAIQIQSDWDLPPGIQWDSATKYSGKIAAKVTGAKDEYRLVRQVVPIQILKPGTKWKLSCKAKGEGIQPGSLGWMHATLRFAFRSDKTDYKSVTMPMGEFDWTGFEVEATIPENLKQITIEAGLNGNPGTLWLDDISLTPIQ